jgi:hypothetical protein
MKKLSVANQVLNILNTQGGMKPKALIVTSKAKPASVYNALNQLRSRKMVTKDAGGNYYVKPRMMPLYNEKAVGSPSTTNLLKENKQLTEWTQMWKRKCDVLERDYTQAKIMYLDSQAVVRYLEEKVAQLIKE